MAVKKTIEINVKTDKGVKNVDNLNKSVKKTDKQVEATKKTTDSLVGALDRMTGGAITAFRGIVSGAKSGVVAMKSLKVAMISTGIGALVVAVGSLVSYFTKTQRGADLISKAFAGIGATVDVLIDRVSAFGEGLFLIFSGKYEEGANKLKNSMKGIGEEIKNESQAAYDLDAALKAVEDREIALIEVNAKRRASIENLRLAAEDETKSDKERAAALQESIDLQNQITDDQIKIAKERARISQAQLDLGESSREDIRKNAELQARVIELEAERDKRLRTVQTRMNAFTKTQEDNNKVSEEAIKRQEELAKAERERLEVIRQLEEEYKTKQEDLAAKTEEEKLELERQRAIDKLERLKGTEIEKREALLEINTYYDEREKEIELNKQAQEKANEEAYLARKQAIAEKEAQITYEKQQKELEIEEAKQDAIQSLAYNGLALLTQIAGKGSQIGKAAAIAQTIMQTIEGVQSTFTSASKSPLTTVFPAYPFIQAGIAGGFGALQIKKIAQVKTPGGGGGGTSPGTGSVGTAPQSAPPPPPSFNIVGNNQANQLEQALNKEKEPLKAYVVSKDMTNQQELDRNIKQTATVG